MPKYVHGRTLDLGAGKVKYKEIVDRVTSQYENCDCFEAPHINSVQDIHALTYPDATFDTVLCLSVLEHVERPWIAAEEIARILKPGGTVIAFAPFIFPYHKDPDDYFRYTTSGLRVLFPGFEVLELEGFGGWGSVLESFWRLLFVNPYGTKPGFIARNVHRIVRIIGDTYDRYMPWPKTVYTCVYIVARKPV